MLREANHCKAQLTDPATPQLKNCATAKFALVYTTSSGVKVCYRGELNSLGGVYLRGLIAGCIGTHGVYLSSCGVYLRGIKQGFEASSAQMLARKRCPEVGQLTSEHAIVESTWLTLLSCCL